MEYFWVVTLFHFQPSSDELLFIENRAVKEFDTIGIEEFSLNESEVDEILGERSYSGGDLPLEVLKEVEEKVLGGPINYRFFFAHQKNAEEFMLFVKNECLCESQIEENKSEDWNANWKKHYSPIQVNESLEIVPSWEKDHKALSNQQIYIYPGMGFGTGSHETTFLCLKFFTEDVLKTKITNCLDFGSGSGILGLSVFKFFPEASVDFYDIDPEANKNCYQNAEINNLQDKSFRLLLPEFRQKLGKNYDLVFANILESILLHEKDSLISHTKPGGFLILSGLLRHQALAVVESYSVEGMKLIRQQEKGDWVALLFNRVI
jgi:ribosomal protein L11 methyltransferase